MYLCKPSREAIAGWSSLAADDAPDYLAALKSALREIDLASDQMLNELLWDYTRLFIGPYRLPCPPWESVYTSQKKLMMQDAADDARGTYAELGLIIDDPNVMPDHIGAELNFLSLAYERAGQGDGKRPDWIRVGDGFLHEHLLNWAPQFTSDMEAAAEAFLYKTLARTTRNTLVLLSA